MRVSDNQIKQYLKKKECVCWNESRLQETIRESKAAFYEGEVEYVLSKAEFLYWQGKYIRKRWWIMQGGVLLLLLRLFELSGLGFPVQRAMGVASSLFAVLLLPELWKNRNTNAMEIECSAYFSLRQIYAARIFLSALVDFLLLCLFSMTAVLTGKMPAEELIIQFFLPYLVTCCICFCTLYSKRAGSETFALLLCIVWCDVWTQFVLNERVYGAISKSVWFAMTAAAFLYLCYCIYRGQKNCKEMWEVKPLWN